MVISTITTIGFSPETDVFKRSARYVNAGSSDRARGPSGAEVGARDSHFPRRKRCHQTWEIPAENREKNWKMMWLK